MPTRRPTGDTRARIRPRWSVRAGLCALALIVLAPTLGLAASPPTFKLRDIDDQWFELEDHLGKEVVYVTFWATWCVPCRRELPHLEDMYTDLKDEGFLVVAVNTDPASAKSKIKPYVRRHKLSFPNLLDPDNNVHEKYNPDQGTPVRGPHRPGGQHPQDRRRLPRGRRETAARGGRETARRGRRR